MADFSSPVGTTPQVTNDGQIYQPLYGSAQSPYGDPANPVANPTDQLFQQLTNAAKPQASTPPAGSAPSAQAPATGTPPTGSTPPSTAPKTGSTPPATPSTQTQSPETAGILERLKPLGITNLNQLSTKTPDQLRTLSQDVVNYENRQSQLNRFFFKNGDGSYDFSRGPDGTATGLDASGKPIPPAGTAAPAKKPPATAPAAKPAPKAGPSAHDLHLQHLAHLKAQQAKRPAVRPAPSRVAPRPKAAPKPAPKSAPRVSPKPAASRAR